MGPDQFAKNEYRDYVIYRELASRETNPRFKRILEELVQHELEDYRFWLELSSVKQHRMSRLEIWGLTLMRRLLGLTFTAKFLERHEHHAIANYSAFRATADAAMQARLDEIIAHETHHETAMIDQIQEERVKFLGSVVLGVNDGLIELTGALVGFASALGRPHAAGLLGAVTGIAAALSMAASAYMQARHEPGRDPVKAALYTGTAYLAVVILLVAPFFLASTTALALGGMFGVILLLIAGFAFYASVLFDRDFKRQVGEMLLFSLGVAAVAFAIGSAIRVLISPS